MGSHGEEYVIPNGGSENRYINWSPADEAWRHHTIETWGRVTFAE